MSLESVALVDRLRVGVVADVALYREALQRGLVDRESVAFVGSASSWEETVELLREQQPTVLVVDMATRDAMPLLRSTRAAAPEVRIVAFAVSEDELLACAEAGVAGFVSRDASPEQLGQAVEYAARGELMCSPRLAAALLERLGAMARQAPNTTRPVPLSTRERQIGALLAEDLANKEIAVRLRIEVATVKNHVHQILAKLRVSRRDQAAAYFKALGR